MINGERVRLRAFEIADDYNTRVQRCYEKCGFRVEGRERQARFRHRHWCDHILMGILQDEFIAPNQDQVSPG